MLENKNYFEKQELIKSEMEIRDQALWNHFAPTWTKFQRNKMDIYRKYTLPRLINSAKPLFDKKVLDLGCGEGTLARILERMGSEVTGVDLSSIMIDKAITLQDNVSSNINYRVGNTANLNNISSLFDTIISFFSLFNTYDYKNTIKEAYRLCNNTGQFMIYLFYPGFHRSSYHPVKYFDNMPINEFDCSEEKDILIKWSLKSISKNYYTVFYYRSLNTYLNAFEKAGFTIVEVSKWSISGNSLNMSIKESNNKDIIVDIILKK